MTRPRGRPRKLSPEQIEEIRHYWAVRRKGVTQKSLAYYYNVHPMTIYNIVHEKGPYGPPVVLLNEEHHEPT